MIYAYVGVVLFNVLLYLFFKYPTVFVSRLTVIGKEIDCASTRVFDVSALSFFAREMAIHDGLFYDQPSLEEQMVKYQEEIMAGDSYLRFSPQISTKQFWLTYYDQCERNDNQCGKYPIPFFPDLGERGLHVLLDAFVDICTDLTTYYKRNDTLSAYHNPQYRTETLQNDHELQFIVYNFEYDLYQGADNAFDLYRLELTISLRTVSFQILYVMLGQLGAVCFCWFVIYYFSWDIRQQQLEDLTNFVLLIPQRVLMTTPMARFLDEGHIAAHEEEVKAGKFVEPELMPGADMQGNDGSRTIQFEHSLPGLKASRDGASSAHGSEGSQLDSDRIL